jgi:hypothetical protein
MEPIGDPHAMVVHGGIAMYSEQHYLSRSVLAKELSELPENVGRRQAYLALSDHWKKLAAIAATKVIILPKLTSRRV